MGQLMKTIKSYISKFGKYIGIAIKGMCMGAADVIPGVSGGTIAFITGIYDTFLTSLNNINSTALKLLFSGKFKELWRYINGSFLVALFTGIILSVLSLAHLMQYLLGHHPIETWAFFFGLIVASSIFILKGVKGWKPVSVLLLVFGVALGIVVCTLSPTNTPEALWFIFISGALAICAMILPGISGSFILLILGKYEYIMGRISELTSGVNLTENLMIIGVFVVGCVVGLLSFSKFLHWLLSKYQKGTILVMAGFILGSLVKVWPWSNMEAIAESQGVNIVDISSLSEIAPQIEMHYLSAALFAVVGFSLITLIEWSRAKLSKSLASGE